MSRVFCGPAQRISGLAAAVLLLACSASKGPELPAVIVRPPVTIAEAAPQVAGVVEEPAPEAVTVASGPLDGRRICIDPGHDAYWVAGASGRTRGGTVPWHPTAMIPLHEHELTLEVAYRLKMLLEAEGAAVCVTRKPREEGGGLQIDPYDFTGDGRVRTIGQAVEDESERIQPRIDWANAFEAELLLSVHFNGSEDQRARGSEVYFTDVDAEREERRMLAASVLAGLLSELRGAGHEVVDRGLRSDAYQRYTPEATRRLFAHNASAIRENGLDPANCPTCYRLLTTGNNPMSLHLGHYIGVLIEVEFLSNPDVVEGFLLRPDAFDVVAKGLLHGLRDYYAARQALLP
jgi:N-acetylmuramoyl-L-alanine amidase